MKTGSIKTLILIILFIAFFVTALWHGIVVRPYHITSEKMESEVKLVVITDLHDCMYGKSQKKLIKAIRRQEPDLILLAGDIADDRKSHDATKQLLSVIGSEYLCFYVSGNHEIWSGQAHDIKELIRSYGVTVLEGETVTLRVGNQEIQIAGVDDPEEFTPSYRTERTKGDSFYNQLNTCINQRDDSLFSILLSHRPEYSYEYKSSGFDLTVSGHAHGGQFRIPFLLNGFYAPHQGFFPKYAGGIYSFGDKSLVVSRGLCKSIIPRVFNPPEVVVITISPP